MILFSAEQAMRILTTWWLSKWTQAEMQNRLFEMTNPGKRCARCAMLRWGPPLAY